MKRSEMVEKLHAKMLEFGFCTVNSYMDSDVAEYDASNVLDFLEQLGMLPPEREEYAALEWDEE